VEKVTEAWEHRELALSEPTGVVDRRWQDATVVGAVELEHRRRDDPSCPPRARAERGQRADHRAVVLERGGEARREASSAAATTRSSDFPRTNSIA